VVSIVDVTPVMMQQENIVKPKPLPRASLQNLEGSVARWVLASLLGNKDETRREAAHDEYGIHAKTGAPNSEGKT